MAKMSQQAERQAWTAFVEGAINAQRAVDALCKPKTINFTVDTKPIPQGSMSGICTTNAAGKPVTVLKADNKLTHGFRNLVGHYALQARAAAGIHEIWAGQHVPVRVCLTFVFKRPKSAPARIYHTVKADIDKLTRSCHDAMSGILYVDDAQVVSAEQTKIYGEPERVQISVQLVGE
jgi:Holliday junction resolvase RusA-like endonuclease